MEYRNRITGFEHEADDLKKEIRLHLPKSLFMPVPREDLLELLLVQDKMANRAKDVSGIVLGRKMHIPPVIAAEFQEFVKRNVDASKQARKSVRELDELFTSGFRGAEVSWSNRCWKSSMRSKPILMIGKQRYAHHFSRLKMKLLRSTSCFCIRSLS